MMRQLVIVLIMAGVASGLSGCKSDDKEKETSKGTPTQMVAEQTAEVACASCIYKMEGVEECQLAAKVDGKSYLVSGSDIDTHAAGLCSAAKNATVAGKIENDKFVSTKLILNP